MTKARERSEDSKTCFVLMPISDADGYPAGHFDHVYKNIIRPSCVQAGLNPIRADEVCATHLIHLDILQRLLEAPIAVCDLSARNPNVLFELGIRQAFDKPVVLIKDAETPPIFDIMPLRYTTYSREMRYHDVIDTQRALVAAINETMNEANEESSVNSIVTLLSLSSAAKLPTVKGNREAIAFEILQNEMRAMRAEMSFIGSYAREALAVTRSSDGSGVSMIRGVDIDSRAGRDGDIVLSREDYDRKKFGFRTNTASSEIGRISTVIDALELSAAGPRSKLSVAEAALEDLQMITKRIGLGAEDERVQILNSRIQELRSRLVEQIAAK